MIKKMNKSENMKKLYSDYCFKYKDKEIVLGDGDIDQTLMMVGEAPGKNEVLQKKPFIGLAGGNLKEFIDYIGKTRQDFYVTNVIKYRLYKVNPKTNRKSNRPARISEIKNSRQYLIDEIDIIKPKIVITLGNVPLKAILNDYKISIGDLHGKLINFSDYIVFPLYHPASLIYNRTLKEIYYRDLDRLKKIL